MAKLNEQDVYKLVAKVLKIKLEKLKKSKKFSDIDEWDSLNHLSIFFELDKLFKNKVNSIPKIGEANSIHKIIALLRKNKLIV
tara:strand:- start:11 stop:259 length:249 start_codon:yes stop_codon:yes gene_type:complete